jgi:hypothetical protein
MLLFSARSERGEKAPQNCKKHVLQKKKRNWDFFTYYEYIPRAKFFIGKFFANERKHP